MAGKKSGKATSDKKTVKTTIKTSYECEHNCPLDEMCLAAKRYIANMIPGRAYNCIVCKGGK